MKSFAFDPKWTAERDDFAFEEGAEEDVELEDRDEIEDEDEIDGAESSPS